MSLTFFTILVLFGLVFLGQHQAGADCSAHRWKDETDVDEGSCSRPQLTKDEDDPLDPIEDEPFETVSTIPKEEVKKPNTEVQEPFLQTIIKALKFIWQVLSIWINFNQ
ncbi:uncharacterized protein LOC108025985 [Drosophila biarmipes]|uniref:uncharacterized protein LOC108025985 n=1 Tax=Drosophila biarmipes TaxID=125945 RepID=UPI001CDA9F2A|nr:uncharacterized protein LOC108025985 [Drosophila biarmipes]